MAETSVYGGLIKPSSGSVVHLPRNIVGQVFIPNGTSNVQFVAHPLGTVIDASGVTTAPGFQIGVGDANTQPASFDGSFQAVTWVDEDTFSVGSTGTWAQGHYLWIYPASSGTTALTGSSTGWPIGGFLAKIAGISGLNVTISSPMPSGFHANFQGLFAGWACTRVAAPCQSISIHGSLVVRGSNVGGTSGTPCGISAYMVDGLTIDHSGGDSCYAQGIYIARCINVVGDNLHSRNGGNSASGSGYLLEVKGCKDVVIRNVFSDHGRGCTIDTGGYGITIENMTGRRLRSAIIDWHEGVGYGITWRKVVQMVDGADYDSTNIQTGNSAHRNAVRGLTIEDSRVGSIQIPNNTEVTIKNTKFNLLQFLPETPFLSFLGNTKVTVDGGSDGINWSTARLQGTLCAASDIVIKNSTFNVGGSAKGLLGSSDASYRLNTGGFNLNLTIQDTSIVNTQPGIPFVNVHGTGTLTTNFTNFTCTGASGTRTVVSATSMSDGGGTWSGVTVNGSAVTKAAGQEDATP